MEETTTLSPVWKFVAHEINQKELKYIHLIIWISGVCVIGFDQEKQPAVIQTYMTKNQPDRKLITALTEQDGILKKHARRVSKIWLLEERNLLIPNSIYEKSQAEGWLRKFHFLAAEESLLHFKLNESVGSRIVFPISEVLRTAFVELFPKAILSPLSDLSFKKEEQEEGLFINLISLPREVVLTLSHNGRFIHHNIYPYEDTENIIYKIALVLQEKGFEQKQLSGIRFSGLAPFWNNILTELPEFFPVIKTEEDTTALTLSFVKGLPA